MKKEFLETEQSVGRLICHDITAIEPGAFKGPRFKKGHRIVANDIPVLRNMGKNFIYVLELEAGELHEDDAGLRLARAVMGKGLVMDGPSEGRYNLSASWRGMLYVDSGRLNTLNQIDDVVISTLHHGVHVECGERVAGLKVIPLVVPAALLEKVERTCGDTPLIRVVPYRRTIPGLVITGCEVSEGRIRDGFAPVLREKAAFFQMEPPSIRYVADDADLICRQILSLIEDGCNLVIVTGGMSVDPDDVTPAAIRKTGAEVIKYGAPLLPGAMFMLSYRGEVPLIGLPACAMYYRTTVLDVFLPRILAGERVTAGEISALGHGGLCRNCEHCVYPHCSFGK